MKKFNGQKQVPNLFSILRTCYLMKIVIYWCFFFNKRKRKTEKIRKLTFRVSQFQGKERKLKLAKQQNFLYFMAKSFIIKLHINISQLCNIQQVHYSHAIALYTNNSFMIFILNHLFQIKHPTRQLGALSKGEMENLPGARRGVSSL